MKTCPHCNFSCQDTDIVCTNCGYLFNADGTTPPENETAPQQPGADYQQPGPSAYQQPDSQAYQQPNPPVYQQPYSAGQQGYSGYQGVPAPQAGNNGLSIAGFVLGLVGILFDCCAFGALPAIPGLILRIIAYSQVKKSGQAGKGFAIAGIVISAVAIVLCIAFWVYILTSPDFWQSFNKSFEAYRNSASSIG